MDYEDIVRIQISEWENKLHKPPGFLEKTSMRISGKINGYIPKKFQHAITAAVKGVVRTSLFGAEFTPKTNVQHDISLYEADEKAKELLSTYRKIAAAEGAGTGAGGIALSLVDFPVLIAIKMKFLFELAHVYGFDTAYFSERIFLIHIFQLTFSGQRMQRDLYIRLKDWETLKRDWTSEQDYYKKLDWEQFQQEYRDALDFRKLLQMLPGIGAVAGAWANYGILEELGTTGMNMYRLRRLARN